MLKPLGYQPYFLSGKKLAPFTSEINFHTGDMLYIPDEKRNELNAFL